MALTVQEMKDVSKRLYDEANAGNVAIFEELLAPDFVSVGGAGFKDLEGPAGFAGLYRTFLEAFPDLTFRVDDFIAENDLILARGTLGGTHKGDFMGMAPPTDKYISWTGSAFFRFNDAGLIDRRWQDWDGVAVMQQLEVVPGPYVPKGPAPTPPSNPGPATSPARARELLAQFLDRVWNGDDVDFVDELFHEGATSPSAPDLTPGPVGIKQIVTMIKIAFPDYWIRSEQIAAEEDKIAVRFVQGGTHEGDFMGLPPTGRTVEWTETGILRFEGGKVVESWYESDILGLMQQLGVGETAGAASG